MEQESQTKQTTEKTAETPAQVPPHKGAKKSMKSIYIVVGLLLVIALIGGWMLYNNSQKMSDSSDKTAGKTIKIGKMLPLSGPASGSGYGESKGIDLAKKQLGASNVEIIQGDSKCDAAVAAEVVKDLIQKGVVAIIGEACSSASLAALPDADANKVVIMSPSSSSPVLSKPDDYFFRVVPPDDFQGKFMAEVVFSKGIKTAAVLHTNEVYGNALSSVFKKSFEALGGKVVSDGSFAPDDINLTTQVAALKAAKPGAIYVIANGATPAVAAMKTTRAAGVTAPFFGSDGLYDPIVVSDSKGAAEGLTITSFSTGTKAFKQALTNAYPSDQLIYGAPQAYDAFQALYLAIQKGATTGEEIKNILPSIEFDGVSGHIKFDQNGETSGDYKYAVLQVKNGEFVVVE
jgi:branched-chain amino acid transport system substrate-binding protein